jgi:uncharacterized protein YkwD
VRAVFDLLHGRGAKRIEFHEAIPPRADRALSPLPPPRADALAATWGGVSSVAYWSETGYFEQEEELTLVDALKILLEAHRRRIGLPGFGLDPALGKAARLHADEMARLGYFGHFSPVPGNRSPGDRLAKQGRPEERRHAELLAKADTAEAAFEAILAKPENAKILADPAFKYAGVARSGDCWVVLLGAEG